MQRVRVRETSRGNDELEGFRYIVRGEWLTWRRCFFRIFSFFVDEVHAKVARCRLMFNADCLCVSCKLLNNFLVIGFIHFF